MREILHGAILAAALAAGPAARAGDKLKPTIDFNDMRVVVVYLSTNELMGLQYKFGSHLDRRDIRQTHRHGFSILKKNRETGALTCETTCRAMDAPARSTTRVH